MLHQQMECSNLVLHVVATVRLPQLYPLSSSIGHTQRQTTINYTICLLFVYVRDASDGLFSRLFWVLAQICLDFVWDAIQSKHEIPRASREKKRTKKEKSCNEWRQQTSLYLDALISSVRFYCLNFIGIYSVRKKDDNFSFSIYSHLSSLVVRFVHLFICPRMCVYSAYVILFPAILSVWVCMTYRTVSRLLYF